MATRRRDRGEGVWPQGRAVEGVSPQGGIEGNGCGHNGELVGV